MGPSPQSVPHPPPQPHVLAILPLQSGTSRAAEKLLNIHTPASVLFFAIYLRARTLLVLLLCLGSKLLGLFSLLWLLSADAPDSRTSWSHRKQTAERGCESTRGNRGRCQVNTFPLGARSPTWAQIFPNLSENHVSNHLRSLHSWLELHHNLTWTETRYCLNAFTFK